jgi:hypothetical protein
MTSDGARLEGEAVDEDAASGATSHSWVLSTLAESASGVEVASTSSRVGCDVVMLSFLIGGDKVSFASLVSTFSFDCWLFSVCKRDLFALDADGLSGDDI